jgi:PAS domain S-box-containing protein
MTEKDPLDAKPEGVPANAGSPDSIVWERQFLEQKEVYRQILDAIDDMVLVKGERSRIVWANRAFCDYYGMTNEQLHEIVDAPFNEEGNTQQYVIDDRFVYTTGQTRNIAAEKVTRHDGVVQLFNTVKSPLRDHDGRVRLTVGVSRNITAQKEIENQLAQYREQLEGLVGVRTRELRRLSDRLQVILRSLVEGIVAVDAEGRVMLMNESAENLTGWSQADGLGRHLPEILQIEEEKTRQDLAVPALFSLARIPAGLGARLNAWLKPREGELRLVSINASPLIGLDGGESGSVLIIRDISIERQIENQNLRNQKLESLGLLAGGIAHDFNNLLMSILGNLSLARHEVPPGSPTAAFLENAESACHRARGLSTQLLTFAHGGAPVKQVIHLERPVREAAELPLHGSSVTLDLRVSPSLDLVEADEGQLVQAVNNLVLNAKQAMPGGGRVFLALDNVTLDDSHQHPTLPPGRYVRIKIQDTGPGIPPEHLSRIFDPYFTTKKSGSGIGLTSVHSIVTRHGGHVEVSSPFNSGACFTILLPASSKDQTPASPVRPPMPNKRVLKLLALDDDPSIRGVFKLMLTKMGHRVTVAGTSGEALDEFSRALGSSEPYDLVFVDLTMPGDFSGEEVINKLRAIHPDARIVIMSGYSTSSLLSRYSELGLVGALAKPFDLPTLQELLNKV